MVTQSHLHLAGLAERLQRLPFALTLSDLSQEDHPLIFVNDAFGKMTGFGDDMLGRNCRFLQSDLPNESARAEIRSALRTGNRLQVVLRNRRKTGEAFLNMLLLENVEFDEGEIRLAVGSQFDLGADVAGSEPGKDIVESQWRSRASEEMMRLGLERRRVMADATIRLIRSWLVVNAITEQR